MSVSHYVWLHDPEVVCVDRLALLSRGFSTFWPLLARASVPAPSCDQRHALEGGKGGAGGGYGTELQPLVDLPQVPAARHPDARSRGLGAKGPARCAARERLRPLEPLVCAAPGEAGRARSLLPGETEEPGSAAPPARRSRRRTSAGGSLISTQLTGTHVLKKERCDAV